MQMLVLYKGDDTDFRDSSVINLKFETAIDLSNCELEVELLGVVKRHKIPAGNTVEVPIVFSNHETSRMPLGVYSMQIRAIDENGKIRTISSVNAKITNKPEEAYGGQTPQEIIFHLSTKDLSPYAKSSEVDLKLEVISGLLSNLTDTVAKKADTESVTKLLQIKANINNVLSLKASQNFTDDEKEIASVNGGYRYRLYAPEAEAETIDDTEHLKYSVKDYAINIILLDTAKPVRIHLPAPVDTTGRCRDFIVKLKVTSEALPSVEFVKNGADKSIAFESSDEDWATVEAGINYFTFTETERVV